VVEKKKKKFSVEIIPDECKGCWRCVNACPENVLKMSPEINQMGYPSAFYTGDGCIGCGACFYNCPEPGAVNVYEQD